VRLNYGDLYYSIDYNMNTDEELLEMYDFVKLVCTKYNLELPESTDAVDIGLWLSKSANFAHYTSTIKKAKLKRYIYLVTFTLKPDAINEAAKAEQYVIQQVARSALHLVSFVYVKELTKQGVPHWHCVVETTEPLKKNRFAYYEKLYGHVDLSRTKGQTTHEALAYISKDGDPVVLL